MLLAGRVGDHGRRAVEQIQAVDAGQPVVQRVAQSVDDRADPAMAAAKSTVTSPVLHAVLRRPPGLMGDRWRWPGGPWSACSRG